jgi:hypothetical protein
MKLTQADFEYFKKECLKWIDIYGMTDFRYEFLFEDNELNYGQMDSMYVERRVRLSLCKEWEEDDRTEKEKKEWIKYTAYHEVVESLLSRVRGMIFDRSFNEDEANAEIHCLIHKLESSFEKYNKYNRK